MLHAAYHSLDPSFPAPKAPAKPMPRPELHNPQECVDAQTAGLGLFWSRDYTLVVSMLRGELSVGYEFPSFVQKREITGVFEQAGPCHYLVHVPMALSLPRGFNGLVLPSPARFEVMFEGCYMEEPDVVPTLIDLDRRPAALTILCRLPGKGEEHVFHAGELFAQVIPTPRGSVPCRPMDGDEAAAGVIASALVPA